MERVVTPIVSANSEIVMCLFVATRRRHAGSF
jgi:hypothetical protein